MNDSGVTGKTRRQFWLLYFAAWTVVGLFWATRSYWIWKNNPEFPITWLESMVVGLLEWYLWGLFALLIYRTCLRLPLQKSSWGRTLGTHMVFAAAISLVQLFLYNAAERPIDHYFMKGKIFPEMQFFWPSYFYIVRIKIHSAMMTYALIAMVSYVILYYRQYRQKELHAAELSTQLANAQLQALKSQLHPHFLFNTLHSISSLMHEDTAAADRMVSRLSELLRMVLKHSGQQTVSLRQELEFVDAYLEIERVRFSDRLRTDLEIYPPALDAEVPSLLLQPLVENAIRYGIAPRPNGGRVRLAAACENGRLWLTVADDGGGLGAEGPNGPGRGIGLANVRERLWRLYGDGHEFVMNNKDHGLTVSIVIPLRKFASDRAVGE